MLSDKLLNGTYRGIEFRFRETGKTGGRKTVFHTYPNSDITLAEDLGRSPISISFVIIIQGDENSYHSNRDAIIKALESDGPTILEHPTYGQLKVQIENGYRINERIDRLGYSEINVSFRIVDNKKFMTADQNTSSYVDQQRNSIVSALENTFMANLYTSAKKSYETVKEYTETIISEAENVTSIIFDTLDDYDNYNAQLTELVTFYPDKIANLGGNITDIFETIDNKVTNPLDAFNFYTTYFDFLDDAETFSPTTKDLYYAQNNQNAYKAYVQGMSLAYATSAASDIDYSTDVQQNEIIDIISDQYEKVLQLPFISEEQDTIQIDTSRDLNNDFEATDALTIYNNLQSQKISFTEFMKEKAITTPKVVEVDIINESLNALVYRYYGNLDNYDIIKDLNNLEGTSYLTGTYMVITS